MRRATRHLLAAAILAIAANAAPARAGSLAERLGAALTAGRVAEARGLADSALAVRERRDARRPLVVAGFADSLGMHFFSAGSPEALEQSEPYFARGLALRERALGPRALAVANSASGLANVNDYLGRWERALELERRALAIRTDSLGPADPRVAGSHRQIGTFLFYSGRYEEADAALAHALAVLEGAATPDAATIADLLNGLGETARVRERFGESEQRFRRGLAIADSAGVDDDRLRAALVNNLAGLYKDLARYDDAEPLLERSLELRRREQPPDPAALATGELNRGEVLRLQGRLEEAEPCYARALELSRGAEGADHPDRIPLVNQAATLAAALGRVARAESLFLEAERMGRRLGEDHPLLAQTLHDLAELRESQGAYAAAESTYELALAMRVRRFGEAHPEVAVTRVALARCLAADPARGAAPAALHLARAADVLERSPWYPEAGLEAEALAARLAAGAGDRDAAIRGMRKALDAVDRLRARRGGGATTRTGFVGRHLALYDDLIAWQLEAGDAAGAFETHERARARTLLDQISGSGVNIRAGIPPADLAALDAQVADAERRLGQSQQRLEAVRLGPATDPAAHLAAISNLEASRDSAAWELQLARERIRDRSPLWRELLSADGHMFAAADIQRGLVPGGSALLDYHIGERGSWVFVLPPPGRPPRAFPLELDAETAAPFGLAPGPLTARALDAMVLGDPDAASPLARVGIAAELSGRGRLDVARRSAEQGPDRRERRLHALWTALLPAPAWRAMRGAGEAAIVPDGALHLIPFEALVVRPRRGKAATRYWLDDGPALGYGASATSMLALARRVLPARPRGPVALSVSDPAFAPATPATAAASWKPLPATREESVRLVRAFAPESVTVLSGTAANEPAVRGAIAGRRLLHFATHGFVTEKRGDLLAGLVLAAPAGAATGTGDDGVLQLHEIYGLALDCDLAVLSACETHRGPRAAGEGVYALSRGFLAAGARNVVASLWPVPDDATAALIGAAFGGIADDWRRGRNANVARRLRDARRLVKADARWSDPADWSAFVLAGAR